MQLASAWRNGQFVLSSELMNRSSNSQAYLFNCLRSIHSYDQLGASQFKHCINEAFDFTSNQLSTTTHQMTLLSKLRYLQSLVELEEIVDYTNKHDASFEVMADTWQRRLNAILLADRFDSAEQVLAVRTTALLSTLGRLTKESPSYMFIEHYLCQHLLKISQLARKNNEVQLALNALRRAQAITKCSINTLDTTFNPLILAIEEAKLLWKQGEHTLAMRQAEKLLETSRSSMNERDYPQQTTLLRLLGKWKTEERMEHPETVILRYFEPASAHSDRILAKDLGKAEYLLAIYADQQLQHMIESPELQQLRIMYQQKYAEVRACDSLIATAATDKEKTNLLRHRRRVDIQARQDNEEIEREYAKQQLLLEKSLENYLRSLKLCNRYNLSVFRATSLWFKHNDNQGALTVTARWLPQVPSHKFIPLVYQLSARMENVPGRFPEQLISLVRRMARKHPFHTLYQIIALRSSVSTHNSNSSNNSSMSSNNSSSLDANSNQSRAIVARAILKQLKNDPKLSETVNSMELLADAYMEIALLPVARDKLTPIAVKEGIPFERKLRLPRLEALPCVPVITHDLPIEPTGNYSDFVSINGFGHRFRVAGGVNLPRIIECQGSDGIMYTQLVKGNDDLRQDAVLEQVFGIVNQLLLKNMATRERQLKLRTYKVVPLSPRSGVLQWVDNTCPLGDYLSRAHKIYRPKDWAASHCRQLMSEEHAKAESTVASKILTFTKIQQHFKPVFRYFFIDQYQDARLWFERRNSYTKSVAASSMVGYVLGIGDRHAQNILIDTTTAEVVHIDLGIAFDQGKLLPTPERVPFRLTRDMIDGMGITGTEGVYRKGCEEVLRVLRENSSDLLAILDVFRYDPLYNWEISPLKAIHLQEGDTMPMQRGEGTPPLLPAKLNTKPVNTEAERALATVQSKLARNVDVSCKVNDLIREATSEENLCRIYPGWQPWF
ncbi:hypothetical protein BDF19DRAFT_420456 [Syncephalis fuscata]|nr:hypothetical protein BDF19DRAFT_420456 [Syncephalis fuscata]